MFDPHASLARIGLLFAFVLRLLRVWRGAPSPAFKRAVARMEAELAHGLRATLADAGIAAPNLTDRALIAWVAHTRPLAAGPSPGLARLKPPIRVLPKSAGDRPYFHASPRVRRQPSPGARSGQNARAPPGVPRRLSMSPPWVGPSAAVCVG